MKELKIIVCLRQVPDPDGCKTDLVVDSKENKVTTAGIPPVINPFDENALEAAIQLKEKHGGWITAVCIGDKLSKSILSKAVAAGADELIFLEDEAFKGVDSYSRAYILSCAVRKIGEFDIILTGMQTSDWGFSQVGVVLSEILQIPSIAMAQSIALEENKVIVKRALKQGYQMLKASMPALVTADSLLGDLRYPPLSSMVLARKKSPAKWGIKELDINPSNLRKLDCKISLPPERRRKCQIVDGRSGGEMGKSLARLLYKEQILSRQ